MLGPEHARTIADSDWSTGDIGPSIAPEDIMVVVAGGPGTHSAVIPTWATRAVTVRIE